MRGGVEAESRPRTRGVQGRVETKNEGGSRPSRDQERGDVRGRVGTKGQSRGSRPRPRGIREGRDGVETKTEGGSRPRPENERGGFETE